MSQQPNPFVPARKEQSRLRLAITGPSGSGKTWTALLITEQLAALRGGKIAFLDTEGRSARKYAGRFSFDVLDLSQNYEPKRYIAAIQAAAQYGYAAIVIDSFSHAWNGVGGVLEIVDRAGKKMGGNDFAGWSQGRPAQNQLVDTLLNANIDIIGTMRSKTDWVLETDERGKTKPVKRGLAAVQSADFEYEFDVVINMDMTHTMSVSKSRCQDLVCEEEYRDTAYVATSLFNWLSDGDEKVSPAWYEVEAGKNLKQIFAWARQKSIVPANSSDEEASDLLLSLVQAASWAEFETGKLAWETIVEAYDYHLSELNGRNEGVES